MAFELNEVGSILINFQNFKCTNVRAQSACQTYFPHIMHAKGFSMREHLFHVRRISLTSENDHGRQVVCYGHSFQICNRRKSKEFSCSDIRFNNCVYTLGTNMYTYVYVYSMCTFTPLYKFMETSQNVVGVLAIM